MFRSITWLRPKVIIKKEVVYQKDPHGLIARDLAFLRKYAATGKYSVGDTIESVAYRQGQADLLDMIEHKLIARPQSIK